LINAHKIFGIEIDLTLKLLIFFFFFLNKKMETTTRSEYKQMLKETEERENLTQDEREP
jgi:hypothetical protein